jgi:hypothetical protein
VKTDDIEPGMWVIVTGYKDKPKPDYDNQDYSSIHINIPTQSEESFNGIPLQVKAISLPFLACVSIADPTRIAMLNTSVFKMVKALPEYVSFITNFIGSKQQCPNNPENQHHLNHPISDQKEEKREDQLEHPNLPPSNDPILPKKEETLKTVRNDTYLQRLVQIGRIGALNYGYDLVNRITKMIEQKQGTMPCPLCQQTLTYSVNEHSYFIVQCSTTDCISFKP